MNPLGVVIRLVCLPDRDQWTTLYRDYRSFYELASDDRVVERVWNWVTDPNHEVSSSVAVLDDELVGLANYRRFARPSSGSTGIYLDDLFVAPMARGRGIGKALLRELSQLAEDEGHSVVRWITAADNATARSVYDSVTSATKWVTYDLTPGSL